jgi:hypothetical protein
MLLNVAVFGWGTTTYPIGTDSDLAIPAINIDGGFNGIQFFMVAPAQ